MNSQMLMGAIPAGIGLLLGIVGLIMAVGGFFPGSQESCCGFVKFMSNNYGDYKDLAGSLIPKRGSRI